MSLGKLVSRSLLLYWRTGLVVIFGVAVASAVITGSLVIGDSVTGSLRDTALARLGLVTHAVVAPETFRDSLADDLRHHAAVEGSLRAACALLVTPGGVRHAGTDASVPNVSLIGVDPAFWRMYPDAQAPPLAGRDCAVNEALARDLGISVGDELLLTGHRQSAVSATNLFARRELGRVAPSMRVRVAAVLIDRGPGDFSTGAQSGTPRNLFLERAWLASRLDLDGLANTLLVAAAEGAPADLQARLQEALGGACSLADLGLGLQANAQQGYVAITHRGLLLSAQDVSAAQEAAAECSAQAALTSTYLADKLTNDSRGGASLSYAVVCGLQELGPFTFAAGGADGLGADGIWLNTWAAEDLKAQVGDSLTCSYMAPTEDGTYPLRHLPLRVKGIVQMAGPAGDPGLAPDFEGITDAGRMQDWDPPFPLDLQRITDRDEAYWDSFRATPKAFVSPDTARAMWQSGPGGESLDWVTSVRISPGTGASGLGALSRALLPALGSRVSPARAGLIFRPVRAQAVAASRGTSDFSQLFLGLSMFLVFSGAGLAAMLMRLSVDQRSAEAGIMQAVGCTRSTVARVLLAEGGVLAVAGTLLGVPLGLAYAAGLVRALGGDWSGALGANAALWLHVTVGSLCTGALAGLAVGLLSIAWATRRLAHMRPLELLAGMQAIEASVRRPRIGLPLVALCVLVPVGVVLGLLSGVLETVAPEVAFFGIGVCALLAALSASWLVLARALQVPSATRSLFRLAVRNAAANSRRSLLVVGLLGSATFVIVAVAANTRDLSAIDYRLVKSGTGGFALQATSSIPLPYDPGTPKGRANLGFSTEDEAHFSGVQVIGFRGSPGEDISCLNIARPSHPRLLGVPDAMTARGGFSPITGGGGGSANPWELLRAETTDGTLPAFGDAASVRWTLRSGLGQVYRMPGPDGHEVSLRFVGLLPGSIFAREVLISQENLARLYPQITAPSHFLISTPAGKEKAVAEAFRRALGDVGLQVRTTAEVLNEFLQVQNTYLVMFLALGGLGLLLGSVGVVTVQVRAAMERRPELALMTAAGFTRDRLVRALVLENVSLLVAGLVFGTGSALVAVAPQLSSVQAHVNWLALTTVLSAILAVGVGTCALAVSAAVRGDLIQALRSE